MTSRKKYLLLAVAGACALLAAALALTRDRWLPGAEKPAVTRGPDGCLLLEVPGEPDKHCFSARPVRMLAPKPGVKRPEFTKQGYEKPILLVGEPENRMREFADAIERSPKAEHTVVDEMVSIHFPTMNKERGGRVIDLGAGLAPTLHFFTDLVGPNGRYLMVDVDPRIIDFLEYRVSREDEHHKDRQRVVLVQNTMDDPCLPRRWADLVFLRNIHYWVTRLPDKAGKKASLKELRRFWASVAGAVAKDGRLVVVENYAFRDGLTLESQLQLIASRGLRRVLVDTKKKVNWVAVFER